MEGPLLVEITDSRTSVPEFPVLVGQVRKQSSLCAADSGIDSVCREFALHLHWEKGADEIPLDLIHQRRCAFGRFLVRKEVSRKIRASHFKAINLLLNEAKAFRWEPYRFLSDGWRAFLPETRHKRCDELVRHFALQGLEASALTRHDINVWINRSVNERVYSYSSAFMMASRFTAILRRRGFTNVDPIAAARLDGYGKPLKDFPEPLKSRVQEFISYRTRRSDGAEDPEEDEEEDWDDDDVDAPTPRTRRQIRAVSAQALQGDICRLYGFLCRKGRGQIERVEQLYEKKVLRRYKKWLELKRPPWAVRSTFQRLIEAALQQESFASQAIRLENFLRSIPREPEPQRRKRTASKSLPYEDLKKIPPKILEEKQALLARAKSGTVLTKRSEKRTKVEIAQLSLREFLVGWMLVLPWRSRNICECRIGGPKPNLFKLPLDAYPGIELPQWAQEAKRKGDAVWQFRFSAKECKGKDEIHRVLPRSLVGPLETYLKDREDLIKIVGHGADPNTLFVNSFARKLTKISLSHLICEITLTYEGKRSSTKIFRDVYAFAYLVKHREREKFANLAWLLWHKNEGTTRRYYASEYSFRLASVNLEQYLKARAGQPPADGGTDLQEWALNPWVVFSELFEYLIRMLKRVKRLHALRSTAGLDRH